MNFVSLHFILFFPTVLTLYFIIPHKYRWALLLAASYYFYMSWKAEYVILLIIATLTNYYTSHFIAKTTKLQTKKILLALSLTATLSILFTFKYWNFFNETIQDILSPFTIHFTPIETNLLLPIGISFYTFQAIGYTIDVYRGHIPPEKKLGTFAVFVSFFPQLVAGPIERAKNLIPQIKQLHKPDFNRIADGAKIMMWGYFKKIVIADTLALYVDQVYKTPDAYLGMHLIVATIFFGFQIYCDFSGYTDIARGAAKTMGINLMQNFNKPYSATSIPDFWRRWHISLMTWFRDYIYIPLGGNKVKPFRWYTNILIVFFISGLWHGAAYTFVLWGLIHGVYMILSHATKHIQISLGDTLHLSKLTYINKTIKIITTFTLVNFAWIFFRADTLQDAYYIITHLLADISAIKIEFTITHLILTLAASCLVIIETLRLYFKFTSQKQSISASALRTRVSIYLIVVLGIVTHSILKSFGLVLSGDVMVIILSAIVGMELVQLLQTRITLHTFNTTLPLPLRWTLYYAVILTILLFGTYEEIPFIYFQF